VPFADHRILEYIYNVPWSVKFEGGVEKALLRNAMSGFLPKRILERKKSPYPKTQSPEYEEIVLRMLERVLSKKDSTLSFLLDRERLSSSLASSDATWYGQLMARPQLIAWLIELDAWLEHYKVEVIL
jgi:asparagine synthase (glutamine-hydrolysing)